MEDSILVLIAGILTTFLLFLAIKKIFVSDKEMSFMNFFISDTNQYSLSRLQAVMWAFIIISYQLAAIFAIVKNHKAGVIISKFELEFSEPVLWLLGMSLSSYVLVKGIDTEKINNNKVRKKLNKPKIQDFITGENGLDFSKFQMLIWSLIALITYLCSCEVFINRLLIANESTINELFDSQNGVSVFAPTVDITFIVLMGISQGTYVGKKLIPSSSAANLQRDKVSELLSLKERIKNNINDYEQALSIFSEKSSNLTINQLNTNLIESKNKLLLIDIELNKLTNT